MCAIITSPGYISIKESEWKYNKLPTIFSEISGKYMDNNKFIVLNERYESKLRNQYKNLFVIYDPKVAKKKMISILSYVMEKELPKSEGNIDTMILFDKIQSAINDTLSTPRLKK